MLVQVLEVYAEGAEGLRWWPEGVQQLPPRLVAFAANRAIVEYANGSGPVGILFHLTVMSRLVFNSERIALLHT